MTLFEATKFPRCVCSSEHPVPQTKSLRSYHVGESLIPSARHYLRFIGAEDKLANYGFVRKVGMKDVFMYLFLTVQISLAWVCHQIQPVQTRGLYVQAHFAPRSNADCPPDTDFIALGLNNNAWNIVRVTTTI